jgi:hypothetical protein
VEVKSGWRNLNNDGLHNSSSSPNVHRMLKSRTMKLMGHAVLMEENIKSYRTLIRKLKDKETAFKIWM